MPKVARKSYDHQKTWMDKIIRAKKVRENWKELFQVEKGREYFDGRQNPGMPDHEWITINKIYSHLKAQLPSLYNHDPYFYVKLRRSFSPNPLNIALWEARGKIRQSMLNYLKEELKLKVKARLCIQDAHFAYGVEKTHYYADLRENPDAGNPITGENEDPLIDDAGNPLLEPDYIPVNERYCITRVHPDDFLWDEDAGPLEDTWSWVAQRITTTLAKIKDNPHYNKRALKLLEGKGQTKDDEQRAREERKKGDVKGKSEHNQSVEKSGPKNADEPIDLWDIYDLSTGKLTVICEEGEIPLIDEGPLPPGVEGHPFSILRFTLRDDSPYPIPPISQGLDPQKEYNMSRSDVLKHRKRFNRKYEVLEQALADESELSKLESGEDGAYIRVQQLGTINPIKDAPMDQQRYLEIGYLNQDLVELLGGTTDESRGIAGAESATQAGILDKRLEIKEGDAMGMVIDFVKDIARKLDQLVQTHISRDEAVRVTGPQGEYWELVKAADYEAIDGEFEYAVNVGSTIPRMPQMERASWQAFLTLLSAFPHLLLSPRLMKQMAEMHHIEDEAMLLELQNIGKQMMSGQLPMAGKQGSQPGQGEDRPVSAIGGQAGGPQSLNLPGAGNFNA